MTNLLFQIRNGRLRRLQLLGLLLIVVFDDLQLTFDGVRVLCLLGAAQLTLYEFVRQLFVLLLQDLDSLAEQTVFCA